MLQRRQTIWWFIIGILFILMIPNDWLTLTSDGSEYLLSSSGITKIDGESVITGVPTLVYLLVLIALNFVTIALYKKRVLQSRLTVISIVLSLGLYALILMYRYLSFENNADIIGYNWPLVIPIVNTILGYMALKDVLKDEALVRSLDRLR